MAWFSCRISYEVASETVNPSSVSAIETRVRQAACPEGARTLVEIEISRISRYRPETLAFLNTHQVNGPMG